MQRHEGDLLRSLRQGIQLMIMQRNAPRLDAFAYRMAREQFPRWAQQYGAITTRHANQPTEDHHCGGTRPDKPRWQWPKMARIGRVGTSRRGINRFQGAAWRQALRRRHNFRRRGGCAPRSQDEQRQRSGNKRLQTGSQQKTSPERSSAEKAGFSAGRAYSSIISGVQPSPR